MSDLRVCMREVISEFNYEIEGSYAYCALILFMCSGSGLHVECIFPYEILCVYA